MLCNATSSRLWDPVLPLNHSYSSQVSLGQGSGWPLCFWALLMDTVVGGFLGTRALPPLSNRFLAPSFWVSL